MRHRLVLLVLMIAAICPAVVVAIARAQSTQLCKPQPPGLAKPPAPNINIVRPPTLPQLADPGSPPTLPAGYEAAVKATENAAAALIAQLDAFVTLPPPTVVAGSVCNALTQEAGLCGSACAPPAGTTPPPPLVNEQIFAAGVQGNYCGTVCTPAGNGVTNDTACLQAALNCGDVEVEAGNYLIGGNTYAEGVFVPAGRNIRCGSGGSPDGTVAFSGEAQTDYIGFIYNGYGGSVFGCTFQGSNYSTTCPPTGPPPNPAGGGYGPSMSMIEVNCAVGATEGGLTIANNDFNGCGGNAGCINVNAAATVCSVSNMTIENNSFEQCVTQGIEFASGGSNIQIANNVLTDCNISFESWENQDTFSNVDVTNNTVSMPYGIAYCNETNYINYLCENPITANVCHDASNPDGGADCNGTSFTQNYSGITIEDNTIIGPAAGSALASRCNGPCTGLSIGNSTTCPQYRDGGTGVPSIVPAVYINNTCQGSCTIACGSGSPGSNQ